MRRLTRLTHYRERLPRCPGSAPSWHTFKTSRSTMLMVTAGLRSAVDGTFAATIANISAVLS
jgi:hypothetical protein